MRTVYREKKYTCGEYLDVFIYPGAGGNRGMGAARGIQGYDPVL